MCSSIIINKHSLNSTDLCKKRVESWNSIV